MAFTLAVLALALAAEPPLVVKGRIAAPSGNGLGAAWHDSWFQSPREVRVSRI